jgi:hypothetical protein
VAKLNKKQSKEVDKASGGFEPLDDGVYHARLRAVEVSENPGPSGSHYWKWEFEVVEEPYVNRRLWTNTSLADTAAFKLKELFDAFGEGTDTDTDDLCGQVVRLVVSTRTIQQGARKGEISNQIDRVSPADEEFEIPDEAQTSGAVKGDDGEDLF